MTNEANADIASVEQQLGYRFKEPSLLRTALTHRSRSHEQSDGEGVSYERLEFLGDALLGFLVADWLYRRDDDAPEGVLSRRRQAVVRTVTLARVAEGIGLGEVVQLGRGEARTGGRRKPSLLADTFEAVLGAIYLDGGVRPARAFAMRHLGQRLRDTLRSTQPADDYKTRLQETIQAELQRTPRYRIVSTRGPAHSLAFEVEVLVDQDILGRGMGSSRKSAEQEAAREALSRRERREDAR